MELGVSRIEKNKAVIASIKDASVKPCVGVREGFALDVAFAQVVSSQRFAQ